MCVRRKDGAVRACLDYRDLKTNLKSDSGELSGLQHIHNSMREAKWLTSIDLASVFTQLPIAEEDKRKRRFEMLMGNFREYQQCDFGLKTVPSGFGSHVGGFLRQVKRSYDGDGIENWLDDIAIVCSTGSWKISSSWCATCFVCRCWRSYQLTPTSRGGSGPPWNCGHANNISFGNATITLQGRRSRTA